MTRPELQPRPLPSIPSARATATAAARCSTDVSLAVGEREFLAVVGPSGSGKTTLLRLINRLIDPTEGTVRVAGEDVRTVDPIVLRRRIGYVFQGVGLFPHMTVAENIGITPRLLGQDAAAIARRVDELIELVRLDRAAHGRAISPRAVGRRAPARRRRAGAGGEPAHRPDGRAVRRARSPHPRRALAGLPRPARHARPHHRDDHARHDGGAAAGRPHRGDARRPADRRRHAGCHDGAHRRRFRQRADADAAAAGGAPQRAEGARDDRGYRTSPTRWRACPTISAGMCW